MNNGIQKLLAKLSKIQATLTNREAIGHVVGRAVVAETKDHLRRYSNSHPNRLGGKRTHFVAKAANATFYRLTPGGVELVNNHVGLPLLFYGGTVVPKAAKWLTIPAIAAAHGRRAREFGNLRFVMFGRRGVAALVERSSGGTDARTGKAIRGKRAAKRTTGHSNRVFFWLVKSATIRPHRSVMPLMAELRRTARLTTAAYVRSILSR